jgi:hypothetical protein
MKKYPFYRSSRDRAGYGDCAKSSPQTATARLPASRTSLQRRKDNWRGVMIGVGFALSLGLLAAMITLYPNHISSQTASAGLGPGPYSGWIVFEPIARKRWRQVTFDNRTGRVIEMKEENGPYKELADLPADDQVSQSRWQPSAASMQSPNRSRMADG